MKKISVVFLLTFVTFIFGLKVKFVSGEEYPPFIWIDETGKPAGITVQILQLLEKKLGISFDIELLPFSQALEKLQTGQADMINFIFKTPEREKVFLFSEPVMNVESRVYFRKSLNIKSFSDLTPYLVGVVESDANEKLLRQRNSSITFKYYANSEELILAAKSGNIDVFVMEDLPAQYYLIKEEIFHEFSTLNPISIQQIYFAFPIDRHDIAQLINKGLSEISRQEMQKIIGPFAKPTHLIPVWFWYLLIIGTAVFVIIFMTVLLLNRYLARIVAKRTEELNRKNQELVAANEELDALNQELRASFQEMEAMNEELTNTNKELEEKTKQALAFQDAFLKLLDIASKMTYESIQEKDFLFELLKVFKEYANEIDLIGVALRSSEKGKTLFVICRDKDELISQRVDETMDFQDQHLAETIKKSVSQICKEPIQENDCQLQLIQSPNTIHGVLFYNTGSLSVSKDNLQRLANFIATFLSLRSYIREQGIFHRRLLVVMTKALEYYDYYTKGHSENVANYAAKFAEWLKLDREIIRRLYWAGLVHDVGKIFVNQQILNKNGYLSTEEYEYVKIHPVKSYELLTEAGLENIAHIVRHHHERFDGKGYPDGLVAEQIPFESRILCLADSFDAMTTARPYKRAMSIQEAVEEIKRCSGSQFDPKLSEEFISMILSQNISHS
ncbi:HD domain-containing phosphohydrolase [Thermotoga profunda]|uniref:HD domain-containing phosphohydrolase n=1 Tax=Thermotoga profunda TaxID=1508420 RepID=UPI000596EB95|nr:HD domain-containing phosphohydrolase [Thermotoga profunda]